MTELLGRRQPLEEAPLLSEVNAQLGPQCLPSLSLTLSLFLSLSPAISRALSLSLSPSVSLALSLPLSPSYDCRRRACLLQDAQALHIIAGHGHRVQAWHQTLSAKNASAQRIQNVGEARTVHQDSKATLLRRGEQAAGK